MPEPQRERHTRPPGRVSGNGHRPAEALWHAAEAVDADCADDLLGDPEPRTWNRPASPGVPVHWDWPWARVAAAPHVEVVLRKAGGPSGPPANGHANGAG